MALSKAKKLRQKLAREGKRNPEQNRSPFAFADLQSRTTKTKKDVLYRNKHKNRSNHTYGDQNGSFFIPFTNVPFNLVT
ncbi:hypothetical protein LCL95_01450 [Bacillus timonensis]|nr:hypothetical protein [Bacillus timonensis]